MAGVYPISVKGRNKIGPPSNTKFAMLFEPCLVSFIEEETLLVNISKEWYKLEAILIATLEERFADMVVLKEGGRRESIPSPGPIRSLPQ